MYSSFTLSHTYCLYKYLIETGSFTKNNRLTRFTGYSTQRACRWTGTNKRCRMNGKLLHTCLITQNTAFTTLTTGVDGKHRQLTCIFLQYMQTENINGSTFTCSRYTTDTYTDRISGIRQAFLNDLLCHCLVFNFHAFHQSHCLA